MVPHATKFLCHAIPRGTRSAIPAGGTDGSTGANCPILPTVPQRILASGGDTCKWDKRDRHAVLIRYTCLDNRHVVVR